MATLRVHNIVLLESRLRRGVMVNDCRARCVCIKRRVREFVSPPAKTPAANGNFPAANSEIEVVGRWNSATHQSDHSWLLTAVVAAGGLVGALCEKVRRRKPIPLAPPPFVRPTVFASGATHVWCWRCESFHDGRVRLAGVKCAIGDTFHLVLCPNCSANHQPSTPQLNS